MLRKKDLDLKNVLLNFLNDKISFEELLINYYDVYFDLTDGDESPFHSEVCEKLDFTSSKDISAEEKKYGWISQYEFKVWLKEKIADW